MSKFTVAKLLVAAGIAASTAQPAGARNAEVEIKGPVANLGGTCPNLQFMVASQRVTTHSGTEFDDGSCADVQNGRRVEAEGALRDDGVLVARKVELK